MILLFDIDGTLISCGGAGRRAFARAFEALHGHPDALDGVRLAGRTDPLIAEDTFRAVGRRGPSADEVERLFARYVSLLEAELAASAGFRVLPGASALVERASRAPHLVLGLATGNVEAGAFAKLRRAGLDGYFRFGGYGSDARLRADLVRCGVARGQALAEQALGRSVPASEVWVIGDTELDVQAAHAAGVRAVGVRVGSSDPEALEASGPELLVDDLADARLWSSFGLEGA